MNTEAAIIAFEDTLGQQAALGGDAVEEAAGALLTALRPAVEKLALTLAEEAAIEVSAQLTDATVRVAIDEGAPSLLVEQQGGEEPIAFKTEDLEARLTLRLPASLKGELEEAASDVGDSINAHVVETLARALQRHRRVAGNRLSGTIES
jgi:hypothetical protein